MILAGLKIADPDEDLMLAGLKTDDPDAELDDDCCDAYFVYSYDLALSWIFLELHESETVKRVEDEEMDEDEVDDNISTSSFFREYLEYDLMLFVWLCLYSYPIWFCCFCGSSSSKMTLDIREEMSPTKSPSPPFLSMSKKNVNHYSLSTYACVFGFHFYLLKLQKLFMLLYKSYNSLNFFFGVFRGRH